MRDPRELGWRYCFAIVLILAAVTASEGRPARYTVNFNLIRPWRPSNLG